MSQSTISNDLEANDIDLEFLYRLLKLTPHIPEIKIILVDKDLTNLEVLRAAFPDSKILLCSFHVIIRVLDHF